MIEERKRQVRVVRDPQSLLLKYLIFDFDFLSNRGLKNLATSARPSTTPDGPLFTFDEILPGPTRHHSNSSIKALPNRLSSLISFLPLFSHPPSVTPSHIALFNPLVIHPLCRLFSSLPFNVAPSSRNIALASAKCVLSSATVVVTFGISTSA